MAESGNLNILIETGTDFVLPFTVYDNNGNPLDLTGATVESQLREYAEAYDFFEFSCMHNGSGGRITVTMPHETTALLPFTHGVYDVKVTLADGTISHPLSGEAYIKEGVTKSSDGSILFMLGINSFEDLPEVGNVDRLYFVYSDRKIYRWNGSNYIATAVGNGIQSIDFVEHVDTFTDKYRITYDDGTHFDYLVTTRGIDHISLIGSTGTVRTGVVDQYRIYFSDDTTYDYYVTNGRAFDVKTSYDATQAYEYLDMVKVSGATYVAVQDVPANTSISNTDYWLKIIAPLTMGTVTTVGAQELADATIGGTADAPVLNLTIPRGVTGNESIDDTKGEGDTDYVWSADKITRLLDFISIKELNPELKKSINCSGTSVTMSEGVPVMETNNDYNCRICQCEGYDYVQITGSGGTTSRLYAFVDSTGLVLKTTGGSKTMTKEIVEIPKNSAWFIMNTRRSSSSRAIIFSDNKNHNKLLERLLDKYPNAVPYGFVSLSGRDEPTFTEYWNTGIIDIESGSSIITADIAIYKTAFYDDKNVIISTNTTDSNNIPIPTGTHSIKVQVEKSKCPFESKKLFRIYIDGKLYEKISTQVIPDKSISMYKLTDDLREILQELPNMRTAYYSGEPITVRNKLKFRNVGSFSGGQGGCIYNGHLFRFNVDKTFYVYNFETGETIATGTLGGDVAPHCNMAEFGTEFYDEDDAYPVVYINAYNTSGLPKGTCYVHRINDDYSTTLIQTITVGFTNDPIWTNGSGDTRPYGNFCIDKDNNRLFVYTLRDTDLKTRFFEFSLPSIQSGDVTLNISDIIRYWDCDYIRIIQDNVYSSGRIFVCSGYGSASINGHIYVVDVDKEKVVSNINLNKIGIPIEPEFIDVYNDYLYCGTDSIYKFYF